MIFIKNQGGPRAALANCPLKDSVGCAFSLFVGVLLISNLLTNAHAQLKPTQPDAGSIYKQIEQGLKLPAPSLFDEKKPVEIPKEKNTSELTVNVAKFNVLGNSLLSQSQIDEVLKPYVGKSLTFDELQKIVELLVEQYKQAGWVVRAYLPKQEVGNGEIVIQVVEAKFGGATFESGSGKHRISEARMLAMVESVQPKEKFIHSSAFDRVLLLMDDLPGVGVTGNLVEGQQEGHTDLLLKVVNKPVINGFASVDNTGSASTGPNKFSTSVNLNSPLGFGEQVQTSIVRTTGSEFERLALSAPVGYDGMRAGAHYSNMKYMLVGSFTNLGATGSVRDAGIDLSYPLLRTPAENINITLLESHKVLNNYATGVPTSNYSMNTSNLTYSGTSADDVNGGGLSAGSLSFASGYVNLNGSTNQPSDAQTYKTAGKYVHTNINLSREQTIASQLSAFFAFAVQYANKNLDSSEKIYLGGANGVRAYPTNESGGAAGRTATFELRNRFDENWSLIGFYDYGKITQYQINADVNGNAIAVNSPNNYELQGYGLTVDWKSINGVDLKATVAKRLGTNPAASLATGMDSDGTYRSPRIWVAANIPF
jgi:hemolysin activation/secretion protein